MRDRTIQSIAQSVAEFTDSSTIDRVSCTANSLFRINAPTAPTLLAVGHTAPLGAHCYRMEQTATNWSEDGIILYAG